ncbi:MFS transporter [Blastococcus haudaquaticus]|uniref:MFS transporter, CP family, cyanate transporter n=1 Tax=Blastococcus haudaquaticus TaxID=1938745 RepID=A0A286GG97_9ACTN|nr:MFS transporter [Blastococcus haudaquaticus]SOD94528.1 MFS transporter, CP family, cyanate transporter [Blastococcus haudaquaticus]
MTRTAPDPSTVRTGSHRGLGLIAVAIVLTALNLRTAVTSVGPVLEEIERGLGISSSLAGVITTMPVLCFALIGFAGPALSARYRDSHVLAGALIAMTVGLGLRSLAGAFPVFLAGTALAMAGGALGNVMLPSLVKRHFPGRTGPLVGAYSTAMGLGATLAAVASQPIADAAGGEGWRWGLVVWALPALVAAAVWLAVPAAPDVSRQTHTAVRMRALVHSPTAMAITVFFGVQALQAYVVIGWSAQYLRDSGLSAATAGLLLGLNSLVGLPLSAVIPSLTVRPRLQRPLLLVFLASYVSGWMGLWTAPTAAPWLWMTLIAVGMGTFSMALTLIGLRARTPETVSALSTVSQSWGYVIAGAGPLLVGVLRGATGSYDGMFVIVLVGVAVLAVAGWIATRQVFVDDEVERSVPGWSPAGRCSDVLESAGVEAPAAARVADSPAPRD